MDSPPKPVRIDWSKSPDLPTLAKAARASSPLESEKIPLNIMQTLNMMMHYIPYQRPNSGKAVDWLEDPAIRKVFRTAPVLAKNELYRAYQKGFYFVQFCIITSFRLRRKRPCTVWS